MYDTSIQCEKIRIGLKILYWLGSHLYLRFNASTEMSIEDKLFFFWSAALNLAQNVFIFYRSELQLRFKCVYMVQYR